MTSLVDRSGAPKIAPADERSPQLSRYQVLQKLAVGGMAEIFVAQKHGSPDVCVVKQLHAHLTEDTVVGARFLREAQVASYLNHPHIARLTDARRDEGSGRFYLAMEFIAGQDVETMMFRLMEQRKMLPPELSVTVTLDVLEGLHFAHDLCGDDQKPLEIVHRDLSPRNVMVTYEGRVKIIDFGLARTNLGDFRTAPGMVLGTMRYMSPEQAVAEPVDRRSDVYSWSVVLYEMLSGRPLVMGANAQEVLHAVVTQVPPPLSSLNPALPRALDEVLERGLAKDRRDRFASADELRLALIKAAGPLASIDDERHALIGRFVKETFPNEHSETTAMLESLERGEGHYEPTRLGPATHEVTRATYVQRIQSMQSAAEALAENAPVPEIVELAPREPPELRTDPSELGDEVRATLIPAISKQVYAGPPANLQPQGRKVSMVPIFIVGLSMFLAGGAAVFFLTQQATEPALVLTDLEPAATSGGDPGVQQRPAVAQQEARPVEQQAQEKKVAPSHSDGARAPKRDKTKEKEKTELEPVKPSQPAKSELPEVQTKQVMFPEIATYIAAARKEIETRDPADPTDPKPLKLAADAIRSHEQTLEALRRAPVKGCLASMAFGDLNERLRNVEKCYRRLEDAAK